MLEIALVPLPSSDTPGGSESPDSVFMSQSSPEASMALILPGGIWYLFGTEFLDQSWGVHSWFLVPSRTACWLWPDCIHRARHEDLTSRYSEEEVRLAEAFTISQQPLRIPWSSC